MAPRFEFDARRWLWGHPAFRALGTDAQLALMAVAWGPHSVSEGGASTSSIDDVARTLGWPRPRVAAAVRELLGAGFVVAMLGDERDLAAAIADA